MFGRRQTGSVAPLTDGQPPARASSVDSVPEATAAPQSVKPATPNPFDEEIPVEAAVERVLPPVRKAIDPGKAIKVSRGELAKQAYFELMNPKVITGVKVPEDEKK